MLFKIAQCLMYLIIAGAFIAMFVVAASFPN